MSRYITIEVTDSEIYVEFFETAQEVADNANENNLYSRKLIVDIEEKEIVADYMIDSCTGLEEMAVIVKNDKPVLITTDCEFCNQYLDCSSSWGRGICPNKQYFDQVSLSCENRKG